ncbi:MAG: hypothetical protein GXZ05_12015 [Gammaproteobacteria bacterium]|nr:hypothetical protein [Gammaproteobacteria bacterium]
MDRCSCSNCSAPLDEPSDAREPLCAECNEHFLREAFSDMGQEYDPEEAAAAIAEGEENARIMAETELVYVEREGVEMPASYDISTWW